LNVCPYVLISTILCSSIRSTTEPRSPALRDNRSGLSPKVGTSEFELRSFEDEFNYYEDPYLPPIQNWTDLESAWQEVKRQVIQKLEIAVLIDGKTEGSAMYHFVYSDSAGIQQESKGSYYLKLDSDGKVTEFRQWWTVQE